MAPSIELPTDPSASSRLADRAGLTDVMMGRRPSMLQKARKAPWEVGSSRATTAKRQRTSHPISAAAFSNPVSDMKLPSWVVTDAHLVYRSRTLGKNVECVVEMLDTLRCEVEVSFVSEPQGRKILQFGVLASADSPLLGPWQEKTIVGLSAEAEKQE